MNGLFKETWTCIVPSIQQNTCSILNFTSNFDTISLISSVFLGKYKYFGSTILFIALQTLDNVFETVHGCNPNALPAIHRQPVSFK